MSISNNDNVVISKSQYLSLMNQQNNIIAQYTNLKSYSDAMQYQGSILEQELSVLREQCKQQNEKIAKLELVNKKLDQECKTKKKENAELNNTILSIIKYDVGDYQTRKNISIRYLNIIDKTDVPSNTTKLVRAILHVNERRY
jgi:hypothetical protein